MSKKRVVITIIFFIIICSFILAQFKTLKIDNSEELEIEIRNAKIDYTKPYILEGEQKNKLINILNGAKLKNYMKNTDILSDNTIAISLFGKALKNSNFPVHIYYFIHNPNDSKLILDNKLYSIDKEHIIQLTEFFITSN